MGLAESRPAATVSGPVSLLLLEVPTSCERASLTSLRAPHRNPFWRFFAHLLIRLLVLTPLPAELQAVSVLFPVSLLWPLVSPAEASGSSGEVPRSGPSEPATSAQSERRGGVSRR